MYHAAASTARRRQVTFQSYWALAADSLNFSTHMLKSVQLTILLSKTTRCCKQMGLPHNCADYVQIHVVHVTRCDTTSQNI